jgi:hypothetical protein
MTRDGRLGIPSWLELAFSSGIVSTAQLVVICAKSGSPVSLSTQ